MQRDQLRNKREGVRGGTGGRKLLRDMSRERLLVHSSVDAVADLATYRRRHAFRTLCNVFIFDLTLQTEPVDCFSRTSPALPVPLLHFVVGTSPPPRTAVAVRLIPSSLPRRRTCPCLPVCPQLPLSTAPRFWTCAHQQLSRDRIRNPCTLPKTPAFGMHGAQRSILYHYLLLYFP